MIGSTFIKDVVLVLYLISNSNIVANGTCRKLSQARIFKAKRFLNTFFKYRFSFMILYLYFIYCPAKSYIVPTCLSFLYLKLDAEQLKMPRSHEEELILRCFTKQLQAWCLMKLRKQFT